MLEPKSMADTKKKALSRLVQQHRDFVNKRTTEQLESKPILDGSTLQVPGITAVDELTNADQVMADLGQVDWSFTEENTRYLAHDIHPYPAKFIPHIPAHLIARLSLPGEKILDPFSGSGTTTLEALRLGRSAVSFDANPLSTLIGQVKITHLDAEACAALIHLRTEIVDRLQDISQWGIDASHHLAAQYSEVIPDIPNIDHWFSLVVRGELALLRHLILNMSNESARNLAFLTLSKIIMKVSNQDSETRYVAIEKNISPGITLTHFLTDLQIVQQKVEMTSHYLNSHSAQFCLVDTRGVSPDLLPKESVDLIVTSPPYPNATDYHLYHRFRLYWLGYHPGAFAETEIGSHLKHQRENSGFEDYLADMRSCLQQCYRVLRPGRYATFVVGDGVYKGVLFHTAESLNQIALECGFEAIGRIERPIHHTKRSFVQAARRAKAEIILIVRKPITRVTITIFPPNYRLWAYEEILRRREVESLFQEDIVVNDLHQSFTFDIPAYKLTYIQQLTFSHHFAVSNKALLSIWQSHLENGKNTPGRRKEPKYVTHGIHPYKGKFYPQLAKSLINISGIEIGARIFDPFCGSGTVVLEAFLNGYAGIGCDMHPLAAKISRAKVNILALSEDEYDKGISRFLSNLERVPSKFPRSTSHLKKNAIDEIRSWFPEAVVYKLDWLLSQVECVRIPVIREFLEVILSSIIRDISQQNPRDLRIRRRDVPLEDAPVIELFTHCLSEQFRSLQAFWNVSGHQPFRSMTPQIVLGDCRERETIKNLGLEKASVDAIVTSPPYATALPYIDTDRLSLLVLFGMTARDRGPLEEHLTGSREISKGEKEILEAMLLHTAEAAILSPNIDELIRNIYNRNQRSAAGFRKLNLPALLLRYFLDMKQAFENMAFVLKPGSSAFVVVGDSKTTAADEVISIPTANFLVDIAMQCGLQCVEQIPISVTTENLAHIRNAIVDNTILHFVRQP